MFLRCKTLIFHIFEKMKIGKKFDKNLKNISLTISDQENSY